MSSNKDFYSSNNNAYQSPGYGLGSQVMDDWAVAATRTTFLRRTYAHLAGAVGLFIAIETFLLTAVPEETLQSVIRLLTGGRWNWLIVVGAFMGISWLAEQWANSNSSRGMQYLGLGLYTVAEAVIFLPLLYIASRFYDDAIPVAGVMTAVMFGGMTVVTLITKADFSWMGRYLCWGGFLALGLILCSVLFGFSLGIFFTGAMIALASGYILYHTSNVLHRYNEDQYVAASLALFASVALLFWYILQFVMSLRNND
jgi:FtsH-binding integral membrane protein